MNPVSAILFDRDGTLVEDVPYNPDPDRVRLRPGAAAAVALARARGLATGVVSNQSGIGRGLLTEDDVRRVNERVDTLLGGLDTWEFCPHTPDAGCDCRKPRPGLVLAAAARLGVAPAECLVVGDIAADVLAARAAGAHGVLVPNAATAPAEVERFADQSAPDLLTAVRAALTGAAGTRSPSPDTPGPGGVRSSSQGATGSAGRRSPGGEAALPAGARPSSPDTRGPGRTGSPSPDAMGPAGLSPSGQETAAWVRGRPAEWEAVVQGRSSSRDAAAPAPEGTWPSGQDATASARTRPSEQDVAVLGRSSPSERDAAVLGRTRPSERDLAARGGVRTVQSGGPFPGRRRSA
ncbi:HAD-IIIA family hydrolase [Streptomyces sp. NPDC001851]|uniref:HAD-IIIA family hydrolase n=1 Tax=Streptomyces sp. NPDC001851 TaxID=3154529 RepID=UPI003324C547